MSNERYYLKNRELVEEIEKCRKVDKLSPQLLYNFELLVYRISTKPSFRGYSYLDDMKAAAMLDIVEHWKRFDASRSETPNPFAYFSTITVNAFKTYLRKEKKYRRASEALADDVSNNCVSRARIDASDAQKGDKYDG